MSVGKKRRFKGDGRRFIQLYHNVNGYPKLPACLDRRRAPLELAA